MLAGLALAAGLASAAHAQTCTNEQIAAVIDQTGARLRQVNGETQPRLRARIRELAAKQGWSSAEAQERESELLQDEETRTLDEQAGQLLMKLDRLGDSSQPAEGSLCARVEEAKVAAAQLIEVTSAKSAHLSARIEAALKPAPTPPAALPPAPAEGAKTARAAPAPAPQPQAKAPAAQADSAAPRAKASPWTTETVREAQPTPAALAELPRPVDPGALGFSPEDIRAAGRGFFGSISAGLASVIDFAFTQYGRPTGYILGNEGGGAFLAGLRYGDGTLVTKTHGERKIYWQGPSVGYDFGLAGSRVMFLVYNLQEPDEMLTRFAGVDGSAYLVGGVGMTVLKKGAIILAPIRTGLGLRLGANVGYLKFTPEASINPF